MSALIHLFRQGKQGNKRNIAGRGFWGFTPRSCFLVCGQHALNLIQNIRS